MTSTLVQEDAHTHKNQGQVCIICSKSIFQNYLTFTQHFSSHRPSQLMKTDNHHEAKAHTVNPLRPGPRGSSFHCLRPPQRHLAQVCPSVPGSPACTAGTPEGPRRPMPWPRLMRTTGLALPAAQLFLATVPPSDHTLLLPKHTHI